MRVFDFGGRSMDGTDLSVVDPIVKVVGVLVAAVGGTLALRQYRENQRWRETEFIAKEAKDFFENALVINGLKILDWEKRKIEFDQNEKKMVNRELLRGSLRRGRDADKFSHDQVYIRDLFDNFFDRLGRFEQYIRSGVVSFPMVERYFRYWGELLTGGRLGLLDLETLLCIWDFLDHYGFDDAKLFLLRFGSRPKPASEG
jgi:hypothetical protein